MNWKIVWCWITGHKWKLNIIDIHDLFNKHLTQTCERCRHTIYAPDWVLPLIPEEYMDVMLKYDIKPLSPLLDPNILVEREQ